MKRKLSLKLLKKIVEMTFSDDEEMRHLAVSMFSSTSYEDYHILVNIIRVIENVTFPSEHSRVILDIIWDKMKAANTMGEISKEYKRLINKEIDKYERGTKKKAG